MDKAKQRAHILEGLRIALNHLDEVIKTIRASENSEAARNALISQFGLSEPQAQAILDMQLRRLAALERQKIEEEYQELARTIAELEGYLADPLKILALIRTDLLDIKENYGDARRTKILYDQAENFDETDLIKEEEVLISITQRGYIKRVPSKTYRRQARGGRGVMGMTTRDEDVVQFMFAASTHDTILYFTDWGKVYSQKAYDVPDASRTAKGTPVMNLMNMAANERITATVVVPNFDEAEYLIMITHQGRIKRTNLSEFDAVRPSGLIAITLDEGDKLGWVKMTNGKNEIIVVSRQGQAIRFAETDVRSMGRGAAGVGAMKLDDKDAICGMDVVEPNGELLVVTEQGYAKRTPLEEYTAQHRNGGGVRTISRSNMARTGALVAAHVVMQIEDLTLISKEGIIIRTSIKSISQQSRSTMGVRVMNLKQDDIVASVAVVAENKDTGVDGESEELPVDGVEITADMALTEPVLEEPSLNGHEAV